MSLASSLLFRKIFYNMRNLKIKLTSDRLKFF